eukprot:jgi/Mesen1/2908/ME000175S02062
MAHEQQLRLTSSFSDEGHIPRKYTQDSSNAKHDLTPPVAWHAVPEGTESLALIVEDLNGTEPEGPARPWSHWVVANIPPSVKGLPEGFRSKDLPEDHEYGSLIEGFNDFKAPGWTGPVPQAGQHTYVFTLYALDCELKLGHKVTREKLLDAMEGHILDSAQLTGYYGSNGEIGKDFIPPPPPPGSHGQTGGR